MIKVLQLVGGGDAIGGVEKMLLNYYAYMDRSKVRFDFCFFRRSTLVASHTEFAELLQDANVYDLRLFEGSGKIWGYLKAIPKVRKLIKENKYDIVHINAGRPPLLLSGLIAAYIAGVKVRIVHSHGTNGKSEGNLLYAIGFAMIHQIFRCLSSYLAACSTEAAKYMFGDKVVLLPKYRPIHNAIILKNFLFSSHVREEVRKELSITPNTFVFGHIGRFSLQKNHAFIIEVFAAIHKVRRDSVLWLAGDGELRNDIMEKIKAHQLEDAVFMLGERNDPERLYQGMDALLFPSHWEGLSVVLVEAQSSGLPVFASSCISPEHKITDLVRFVDINQDANYWAKYILNELDTLQPRQDMSKQITANGYNIENEAILLQNFYLNSVLNK